MRVGAYVEDMLVGFLQGIPRTTAAVSVSPPGGSGSSREKTESHLVAIYVISTGIGGGAIYRLLLLDCDLSGVLKRTHFYFSHLPFLISCSYFHL